MMKKKLISVCVATFMLLSSAMVAFAASAAPEVTVEQSAFNVNVTIVTEEAATKAVSAYMRSANTADKKLYGIDDTKVYTEENGKIIYEISFVMYNEDASGDYVVYVNVDGVVTPVTFAYLNTQEKVDFYNALDAVDAKNVYATLTGENSKVTYDLTDYKALDATVRGLVDAEIASWSLATQLTDAGAANYIEKVEKMFVDNMDEVMTRANIANADEATFDAAVQAAAAAGKLDMKYYEKVTPAAVCVSIDPATVTKLDYATIAKLFDQAVLLAVHDTLDYPTLQDAVLYYAEKGAVTLKAGKYETIKDENMEIKLFRQLKEASVTDFAAFEDEIDSIMDDFIKEIDKMNNQSSTGGSGGGGGGGSSMRPRPNDGTTSMGSITDAEKPETNKNNVSFGDLGSASWAETAIVSLASDGVLSGRGDGKFYPNDVVTREEFVKMIVLAFEAHDTKAVCSFADVDDKRWSYSYIASAYNLGLVTGVDEANFDPTGVITREQMAVILARAYEKADKEVAAGTLSFADTDEISGYAKDAVSKLVSLGIMNGMGDNTFAPKANVTRAQAAKAIYETVEKAGVN